MDTPLVLVHAREETETCTRYHQNKCISLHQTGKSCPQNLAYKSYANYGMNKVKVIFKSSFLVLRCFPPFWILSWKLFTYQKYDYVNKYLIQFVNWFFESCIIGFGSFYLCSYVKLISVWGKNFKWLKLGTFDEAIKYYLNLSTYYHEHTHNNNNKKGKKEREKKEETLRSNYAKVHFVNQETNCTTITQKDQRKSWTNLMIKLSMLFLPRKVAIRFYQIHVISANIHKSCADMYGSLAVFVLFFLLLSNNILPSPCIQI